MVVVPETVVRASRWACGDLAAAAGHPVLDRGLPLAFGGLEPRQGGARRLLLSEG
ncbi:hypothetical protein [Streptomyces canus]|uniref:hypothetical protein n=1 Tax=Streptomyces canus TaxID=58343 RepID=UPI00277F4DFD|nr:hypothetical protein [Streptomyces canus]MDQ1066073.1 hypothetical protein [Streptomyces canus]